MKAVALISAFAIASAVGKPKPNEQFPMDQGLSHLPAKKPLVAWLDYLGDLLEDEREAILEEWSNMDVVDLMRKVGDDEGIDEERVVIVFGKGEERRMVTEGEKFRLKKAGYDFMDVTDHPEMGSRNALLPASNASRSFAVSRENSLQQRFISNMIDELDDSHLRADIAKLSSFWTRSYRGPWGLMSSGWVYEHVQAIVNSVPNEATRTSVTKFQHKFLQHSVIARIEAKDDDTKDKELVILGAHQDSLNYRLPFYRSPGGDDDGSGSVTIMQVLRSLIEKKFVPPPGIAVEFQWYAAEEGGLLGSMDIAGAYEKESKKVKGMLQMDMTAFVRNGTQPVIGFFQDQVDKNLTAFATDLVEKYISIPWKPTGCGKTCGSDHMSFTRAGYRAAFATESLFQDGPHEFVHTSMDDTDQEGQYSFEHMIEFVKLGIAYAVELSVA